ncbi:unnamed protein product [Chilo suppressalis]|uniref:Uncharacterized protein n=1 Tax=Chilo suppressalis TaxID=168631 RepID=A0ABN8AYI8_CHISP|nr:unnamed protein product [Chilo suppressalis]
MNFSRAETFSDAGCISKEKYPEQINFQTPILDLSTVYGEDEEALKKMRKYEHGLLKAEMRMNREVPLNETRDVCFQNRKDNPVCYKFGIPEIGNFDIRTTTFTIFYVKQHNRIAEVLRDLNPCWKDDKLFKVSRQINIASAANVFLYELLPLLLGYKNMVDAELISEHVDYVTAYDDDAVPLIFAEYEIARRYFRTFLDGRIKKFSEKYHYRGEFSYSDTLFRQEILEIDSNFEDINRGTFYQHAAKIDDIQDPDISEKFFGELQKAADLMAIDIQRGRDMGLQGYNGYRKLCGLKPAKEFEDLLDVMSVEKMETLKHLYHDIEDIDLLAGIMSENLLPGAFVGHTLFCIMARQVHLMRFADRFWFERMEQYHSFTPAQLREIRKTSIAHLACANANGIKFIQPQAFLNIKQSNEPIPCSQILSPDLSKWYDESCHRHHKEEPPSYDFYPGHQKQRLFYPNTGREDVKVTDHFKPQDHKHSGYKLQHVQHVLHHS